MSSRSQDSGARKAARLAKIQLGLCINEGCKAEAKPFQRCEQHRRYQSKQRMKAKAAVIRQRKRRGTFYTPPLLMNRLLAALKRDEPLLLRDWSVAESFIKDHYNVYYDTNKPDKALQRSISYIEDDIDDEANPITRIINQGIISQWQHYNSVE